MNGPQPFERWVKKNRSESIRIAIGELNGMRVVDVRIHIATLSGSATTRKGLCLRADTAREVILAMQEVLAEAGYAST
jgi:hypothetical protein